jgi:hypothetical protein
MCPLEGMETFRSGLGKVIQPENVIGEPAVLETYAGDHSFVVGGHPQLLVYPESREETQAVIRAAFENGIPLVPVSSGPPRLHGDTVPECDAVVVDFTRMKRIIKIDADNRYVMAEPGVTYGELIPELRRKGVRLNIPFLPRASKSVVTSRLEREPVLIPKYQYDYLDPLLTLEVVYGTGDDFRTGSASGPGAFENLKADKVNPWGPGSFDFFRFVSGAQGTMGFVTWAITKTEVLPSLQKVYFLPIENVDKVASPLQELLSHRVVDECLVLNGTNLASVLAEDGCEDFEALRASVPHWVVIACVAGYQRRPEERVDIQEKCLKDICRDLGLTAQSRLPGAEEKGKGLLPLLSNAWTREPYWKFRRKRSCRDVFFLAPLSGISRFVHLMNGVVSKYDYPCEDIGCYIQPMVQGRGCHCEFTLPCDESNAGEMAMVQQLFMEASEVLRENGAFFSRPYGPWASMVYSRYSEGVAALQKVKGVFDPRAILNPGKLCF